jgi:D-3-phosphoglycerate dehydrogenase / 2-oxoglutarate reductase
LKPLEEQFAMSQAKSTVVRLGSPLPQPEPEQRLLAEVGAELVQHEVRDEASARAAIRDADVVINAGGLRFNAPVFASLTRCRAVIQNSVGYDRIDVDAATARKIMIANLPDYCIEEVSDHAVTLLLASARRIFQMQQAIRDGKWGQPGYRTMEVVGPVERLSEKTLGIVGFGNIGKLVTRKTRGIFARIITADPYVKPETAKQHGVELVSLDELLQQADYVTLHVLLTNETRHLINAERLTLMKPTAYLVNTCRGPVVDEAALADALRAGKLAGAGLDVFEEEPIGPTHPLAQMPNVIVTPHLAVYSLKAMELWRIQPFQDAARILSGHYPRGLVNRQLKATLGLKDPA